MKVLIDAGNLHTGGGVQVAASFLTELAELRRSGSPLLAWIDVLDVEVSPTVWTNLSESTRQALLPTVRPRTSVIKAAARSLLSRPTHDVAFTVFGARYGRRRGRVSVTGCADVTSLFTYETAPRGGAWVHRARRAVRRRAALWSFVSESHLVVETQTLENRLVELGASRETVHVVPNTYHPVFDDPEAWVFDLDVTEREPDEFRFIYVSAYYHHKNFDFLPQLTRALERQWDRPVRCLVTLDDQAWSHMSEEFRGACVNVGRVTVQNLPRLYQEADAAIFPSLLEAFSATPLEAMKMGLPLFASDRSFVRDVCGDGAIYIDPLAPEAAAILIADSIRDSRILSRARTAAAAVTEASPSSRERCVRYLTLLGEASGAAIPDSTESGPMS